MPLLVHLFSSLHVQICSKILQVFFLISYSNLFGGPHLIWTQFIMLIKNLATQTYIIQPSV